MARRRVRIAKRRAGPWTGVDQRACRQRHNLKLAGGAGVAILLAFAAGLAATWRHGSAAVEGSPHGFSTAPALAHSRLHGANLNRRGGSDAALSEVGEFGCTVFSVTDGDTFRCSELGADGRQIRVRVAGISARETDGSCRPGNPCPAATAEEATADMRRLVSGQALVCRANGASYRRVVAFCRRQDGLDVSCAMVQGGTALRWEQFWDDHRCS